MLQPLQLLDLIDNAEADEVAHIFAGLLDPLSLPLGHPAMLRDEVDEDAQIEEYDQHDHSDRLGPAGYVVTAEQVGEDGDPPSTSAAPTHLDRPAGAAGAALRIGKFVDIAPVGWGLLALRLFAQQRLNLAVRASAARPQCIGVVASAAHPHHQIDRLDRAFLTDEAGCLKLAAQRERQVRPPCSDGRGAPPETVEPGSLRPSLPHIPFALYLTVTPITALACPHPTFASFPAISRPESRLRALGQGLIAFAASKRRSKRR
jgi:hypothetical protein